MTKLEMHENAPEAVEENAINLWSLGNTFIHKWYWFVLSLAVALLIAMIYLSITPPVYTRSLSLLVKDDDSKGGGTSSISTEDVFSNMGLFKSESNVRNEILTIKAPILMEEVVKRLGLDVNYTVADGFKRKVLYKTSPINILLEKANSYKNLSFRIELLPGNKYRISHIIQNGKKMDCDDINGNMAMSIQTPLGILTVLPTGAFTEGYIDVPITYSKSDIKSIANRYSSALDADLLDQKATIISVSIKDVSTVRAEDILNTLISVYDENWIKNKNKVAISTSQFINERLSIIERELGGVDNDISSYRSKNLLPDEEAVSQKDINQTSDNEKNILNLNTQLTMTRYVGNYLKRDVAMNQLLPANSGIDNIKIEEQIGDYNKLLLQRNNFFANSSAKNPLVNDMNKSLISMKNAIVHSVDEYSTILKIQLKDLNEAESKSCAKLSSNPNQVKYLLSKERQQKVKEALYLFLLQKREENELSQTFTAYNSTIINPPIGSDSPIAPRRQMILLAALALGLFLPAIILYLLESMDTLVKNRQDINDLTIPFVGEIPLAEEEKKKWQPNNKKQKLQRIVIKTSDHNAINEAFRIVRTNIDFIRGKSEQGTAIMTTSFNFGSGKTFTSLNMAISMALKGSKVIILDVDLRKASLSKSVHSPKTGLSNYLNENIDDIDSIIIKGKLHSNVDVIPVGIIPPNPSELLLKPRFGELIKQLRPNYDYIFLDCPPFNMVTDAMIIGKSCDMTLFIIRAELMDRRDLPDIEEIYKSNQFNKMCIILNGVEYQSAYGYHKYGYYQYK